MGRGPQHQRLAHYVDNADPDSLDAASAQWTIGESLLRKVSEELATKVEGMQRAESYHDTEIWSGATASTARDAFTHSAKAMQGKAEEMKKGSKAFADAATGVRTARKTLHQLDGRDPGELPKAPTFSPGPRTPADETKQSQYHTSVNNWWRDYNANETAASGAITDLQDNHTTQAAVFQSIHGENQVKTTVHGGGDPTSTSTRPTTTHVPGTNLVNEHTTVTDLDHHSTDTTDHHVVNDPHVTDHAGDVTRPGDQTVPTGSTHHGVPQGPTSTTGPLTVPASTTGGGIGAAGGVGAVAGGALGGVAAAGLAGGLAGGLNGGLNGLVPVGAGGVRGGLSASGVRGIGSTSRTGVDSVLGRGTGAGGRAGAGGMSTRGSRSGRSAASRGSRGSAGSRGAGAGSGRSGKDKKRRGEERDLFDDGADWLDDEDAAPGLLD
jgi:hypothetical protein